MKFTRKVCVCCIIGGAVSTVLLLNRRLFSSNKTHRGEFTIYPNIDPPVFAHPPSGLFALVEAEARDLPEWRVIHVDRTDHRLEAEVENRHLHLIDDVTIFLDSPDPGHYRVNVEARSRSGAGDPDENSRRIREYYELLERRVSQSSNPDEI